MSLFCFCEESFGTVEELTKHASQQRECGLYFTGKSTLTRTSRKWEASHDRSDLDIEPEDDASLQPARVKVVCTLCSSKWYDGPEAFEQHRSSKHPGLDEDIALATFTLISAPHVCVLCPDKYFSDLAELRRHIKNSFSHMKRADQLAKRQQRYGYNTFECDFCPHRTFKSAAGLSEHTHSKHPSCPTPTCSKQFHDTYRRSGVRTATAQLFTHQADMDHCYCDEHDEAFSSTLAFEEHLEQHDEEESAYECEWCLKQFHKQQALRDHLADGNHCMQNQRLSESDEVALAEKEYLYSIPAYEEHVEQDDVVELAYRCTECPKVFQNWDELLEHLYYCASATEMARSEEEKSEDAKSGKEYMRMCKSSDNDLEDDSCGVPMA